MDVIGLTCWNEVGLETAEEDYNREQCPNKNTWNIHSYNKTTTEITVAVDVV